MTRWIVEYGDNRRDQATARCAEHDLEVVDEIEGFNLLLVAADAPDIEAISSWDSIESIERDESTARQLASGGNDSSVTEA